MLDISTTTSSRLGLTFMGLLVIFARNTASDLWVRDHKPDLSKPEKASSQMALYREALHRRTSIPKERIRTAVFNEHGIFELRDAKEEGAQSPQEKR